MFKNIHVSVAYLKILTVFYLSISFFIFFYAWLKSPLFIFFSAVLGYLIYNYMKNLDYSQVVKIPLFQLIIGIVFVTFWVSLSGAGGFGYQTADFVKTNALDKDIMTKSVPINYKIGNEQLYLAHYLGYFLPSPFLLKSLGWKYVQMGNYLYTLIGVSISVFWFLRIIGHYTLHLIMFFAMASGIQLFTIVFNQGFETFSFLENKIYNQGFVHWVNGFDILRLTYLSITDMLYWSATHGLACWLGMGLLLNDWYYDKNISSAPFYLMLLSFWSPLVLVGVVPYFLFCLVYSKFFKDISWKNLILTALVFMPIALFITSIDAGNIIHHFIFVNRLNEGITLFSQIKSYFLFLLFEVLIWWVPSFYILNKNSPKPFKHFYLLILVVLCTIPLFRYGLWNDWCTRVSMPSLYALYFMVATAFLQANKRFKVVLISIFLCAIISPLIAISTSLSFNDFKIKWQPPIYEAVNDIPGICVGYPVTQFVTSKNTYFFKYMAK